MTAESFPAFRAYADAVGASVDVSAEAQSSEYESGVARMGADVWHIRTARNTPTKPGAFVAFWRRDETGSPAPFTAAEVGAGLLVFVADGSRRGAFRFTDVHLAGLGVTSATTPGKRGFRVYPPWCEELNAQAARSQRAQAPAFQAY